MEITLKINVFGYTGFDDFLGCTDKAFRDECDAACAEVNKKYEDEFPIGSQEQRNFMTITNIMSYFPVAQQISGIAKIVFAVFSVELSTSDRVLIGLRGVMEFSGFGLLFLIPDIIATVSRLKPIHSLAQA